MSNKAYLPLLVDARQQRELQVFMNNAQASIKGLPGSDPMIAIHIQLTELSDITNQLNSSLAVFGQLAPMLDLKFLTQEGATNVAGLDQHYLLTLGQQALADYQKFHARAVELGNGIKTVFANFELFRNQPTEEHQEILLGDSIRLHEGYVTWTQEYISILGSVTTDILNHLNLHRSPERQINNPFLTGVAQ